MHVLYRLIIVISKNTRKEQTRIINHLSVKNSSQPESMVTGEGGADYCHATTSRHRRLVSKTKSKNNPKKKSHHSYRLVVYCPYYIIQYTYCTSESIGLRSATIWV